METAAIFVGIFGILTYLCEVASIDERKQFLEGETEYFSARMQDIKREMSSTRVQLGKKRKRDECHWLAEGERLVQEAQCLIRPVGGWRGFLMAAKMRWGIYKLAYGLKVHDKKGDILLRQALSDARGLCRGHHIPVKQLVGRLTYKTLDRLKLLLEGDEIGRVVIHGIEGIGKTFLMKHLHNYALNFFDYVVWVTSPSEFTVKCVQDVVAAAVNCEFSSDDDLFVRAKKLSDILASLGTFALFLDGVPKANFTLEQVGIPVPAKGSKCKLVFTTSSSLECRLLDCFETVEIEHLPKEDAYELFRREGNFGEGSISCFDGIPSSLVDLCFGVPRMIENIATRMCSIDDPHEWRYALFELGSLVMKKKLPLFHLGKSETTPSTRKVRLTRNSMK
ncbi:probable disease resistance protein At1g52660 [Spinacia oleracea]|uniref:Probable disease resistance protein At1g52660 n=1 Tax=Spinacia oleracea TaxID=3562 RepID=A0A9R0JST2_SPIOL|nr:probable disease resistance protein At1g52660 [Spinacia oleracea]XP_021845694.2 probable disease resistance protein At1g52660 [Spinacia oleracea]XP_056685174.1 probable disease resistance protein At1g52660 [Spinacia oleracea]XP_056685178.1 probable disease resistance protein At1g52660 [Spinacia oleracea]